MSNINTLAIFYAFAAGACWLLSSLLLVGFDKVSRNASRWLGAFYFILACSFTQIFLENFALGGNLLIHLLELPRWAMLPCLYVAVTGYVNPPTPQKSVVFVHFVPFLLFLVFSLTYLIPGIIYGGYQLPSLPAWVRFTIQYFFFGQTVYYWFVCFRLLRQHKNNLNQLASYMHRIDLKWLHYLLIAVLLLIIIRLLSIIHMPLVYYAPVLYFIGVLLLAYATVNQQSIYTVETYQPVTQDSTSAKEKNERLTTEQVEALQLIVLQKTVDQKLYLDPTLTLSALSTKIGISPHELSYVLNNGVGKTFYQFINELRTEEAKLLLLSKDTAHLDMLGIAIRAGFNSKTTFYTTFKKVTNLTPKAYIKANTNNS